MDKVSSFPIKDRETYSISGVEVISLLPFVSRLRDKKANLDTNCYISGYPGSPLGGLDLALLRHKAYFKENRIVFNPGLNEELAATSVMGSQFASSYDGFSGDGVLGIWYGKAPGLERAMDALRHGVYGGTGGKNAVLLCVGDDPSSNSSSIPTSSSHLLADLNVPTLFPGNVNEILPLALHAVNISRLSGLWTALKINTSVADSFGTVTIDSTKVLPLDTSNYPGHTSLIKALDTTFLGNTNRTEKRIQDEKLPLVIDYLNATPDLNITITNPTNPILGIVAAGNIYYQLLEALNSLGYNLQDLAALGVRVLKLDVIYPLSKNQIINFANGLESLVIIEEKKSFIQQQILEIAYNANLPTRIYGKNDKEGKALIPSYGLVDQELLKNVLPLILSYTNNFDIPSTSKSPKLLALSLKENNSKRIPSLCSGCPHSSSLLLPEGSLVGAGVGCHALGMFMDKKLVGDVISSNAMGTEGAVWMGASPFLDNKHLFQNIGDGTYFHSGSLALRACIDAKVDITFKILYNSSIAMTGGQKVTGSNDIVSLIKELQLLDIRKIVLASNSPSSYKKFKFNNKIVKIVHIDEMLSQEKELSKLNGVSVLISDLECALALRAKRRNKPKNELPNKIVINSRLCENCGDCGESSSCLSLQPKDTPFGTKVSIDQSSCNQAHTCLKGNCPAFISIPALAEKPSRSLTQIHNFDELIPLPLKQEFAAKFEIFMPGIGGTGVIHASKMLGQAAYLEGYQSQGSDSTGLAQKSGSVASYLSITKTPHIEFSQSESASTTLVLGFDQSVLYSLVNDTFLKNDTQFVLSTSLTPTGNMVYNPSLLKTQYQKELTLLKKITKKPILTLDSVLINKLIGNHSLGNMVIVGAALQAGCLPVSYFSLISAIKNSGNLVEENIDALNLGRLAVFNPHYLNNLLELHENLNLSFTEIFSKEDLIFSLPQIDTTLIEKVYLYANELVSYHNKKYAQEYLANLSSLTTALALKHPDTNLDSQYQAITINLYNLMAFKDEFEVARLTILASESSLNQANLDTAVKHHYLWKFPLLKYKGTQKTKIPSSAIGLISLLAKLKFLRFTFLNPFFYSKLRKQERKLAKRYIIALKAIIIDSNQDLSKIDATNLNISKIKGYAELKSSLIAKYLP